MKDYEPMNGYTFDNLQFNDFVMYYATIAKMHPAQEVMVQLIVNHLKSGKIDSRKVAVLMTILWTDKVIDIADFWVGDDISEPPHPNSDESFEY